MKLAPELAADAPLYRGVKQALTQRLAAGRWAPGEALPSEARLAEQYRVSIGTVRKAVDDLVSQHVLVRRQGRGTFVALHDASRLLHQFFRVVRRDGEQQLPDAELVGFGRGRATADEASRLRVETGAGVIRIRNLLRLAGRPVVADDIVLPAALFPDLTRKVLSARENTIYNLYQTRYGINVVRAVEHLRAATADRVVAKLLEVAPGAALLEIERVALTYRDAPVEWRRSLVNTSQHDYLSVLDKPRSAMVRTMA